MCAYYTTYHRNILRSIRNVLYDYIKSSVRLKMITTLDLTGWCRDKTGHGVPPRAADGGLRYEGQRHCGDHGGHAMHRLCARPPAALAQRVAPPRLAHRQVPGAPAPGGVAHRAAREGKPKECPPESNKRHTCINKLRGLLPRTSYHVGRGKGEQQQH
eukprot:455639-Pyramimonas_sp.AAC.2